VVQKKAPTSTAAKKIVKKKVVLHPRVQTATGWKRNQIKVRSKVKR
jgi:hypothetical protein